MMVLGIEDPQIWLAYLASIFSALGCMVYGALHWRGEDDEQAVKNKAQKPVTPDQ
ncbi:MAG: symporter small accessory protein [Methanosarcina sp.]